MKVNQILRHIYIEFDIFPFFGLYLLKRLNRPKGGQASPSLLPQSASDRQPLREPRPYISNFKITEVLPMAYSQQIADRLREIFASMNVNASFEEKANCAIFATRLKLRCRLQSAQMVILVREDSFSTLTTIPLAADEGNRLAVAEYLTRVNFNMRNGNFELNMETGEIRFKTYVHVGAGDVDSAAARLAIMLPFMMIERFGDGLVEVLFGFKSPREAFAAAANSQPMQ